MRFSDDSVFLCLVAFGAIIFLASTVYLSSLEYPPPVGWMILGGGALTWGSLLANVWLQRRHARAQHTIQLLQTVKLDHEYLSYAAQFRKILPTPRQIMDEAQLDKLKNPRTPEDTEFRNSVMFLLNFYEFVSAPAFRKDIDQDLLCRTIRGNIVRLVIQCSPWIKHIRKENNRTKSWEYLVWLFYEFCSEADFHDTTNAPNNFSRSLIEIGPNSALMQE